MKKILLAISTLICMNFSIAQNINNVYEKNGALHISLDNIPFHTRMLGMLDDNKESIERSFKDGASLQFFLSSEDIHKAGVDKDSLVKEVDSFVAQTAIYYKKHPQIKGMQIFRFILFPGYKKPYQIVKQSNNKEEQQFINDLNNVLKKESKCNELHFCSALVAIQSKFINLEDNKQTVNLVDLEKFLGKMNNDDVHVYTNNKNYLEPITYFIVIGINGYLATEEKIKNVMREYNIK